MVRKMVGAVVFLEMVAGIIVCMAQEGASPLQAQKDRVAKVLGKKPIALAIIQPVGDVKSTNPVKKIAKELGIELVTLTAAQMADPDIFTPKKYPVIIYTALEMGARNYEGKDLMQALINYMSKGGILISTGGCWPFYYACDWDGTKWAPKEVLMFGKDLGLFIASKWEKPPEDKTIVIKHTSGDKIFTSLPKEFPYPAKGDLRLRSFDAGAAEEEGGNYKPILTVEDSDGEAYGEVLAVYERPSEFKNSTVIFIWGTLLTTQYADGILADAFAYALEKASK